MNITENNCDMFCPWASSDNSELLLVIAFQRLYICIFELQVINIWAF